MHRRYGEGEQLHVLRPPAEEARAAFGVADRDHHLAELGIDDHRADEDARAPAAIALSANSAARVAGRLHVEAEDVLEVGEAVVAAEAEIVAEEGEQQGEGHRLGDDREIDAGDAAAEGEPAEDEGEQARHQHHHEHGEPEHVEAVPVPGQFLPVEEHHEVGQDRVGIDAARADLAHQVHAHGVAAEREEGAVAEREDAAIAPDQIERERQHGVAEVLAEQRHEIARHMTELPGGISRLPAGTATATSSRIGDRARSPSCRARGRASG